MSEEYLRTEPYQIGNQTLQYNYYQDGNTTITRLQPTTLTLLDTIKEIQDKYLRRTQKNDNL